MFVPVLVAEPMLRLLPSEAIDAIELRFITLLITLVARVVVVVVVVVATAP